MPLIGLLASVSGSEKNAYERFILYSKYVLLDNINLLFGKSLYFIDFL